RVFPCGARYEKCVSSLRSVGPRQSAAAAMCENNVLPGQSKSEEQHRRDVCVVGEWMCERGFIVACEGNLSVRLDPRRILTTPTCMNKGSLSPADLVVTDLHGRQIAGGRKASSELAMH